MDNEVYKEVYGHILNDAQRIRREIMNEWGDILMFGGTMPDKVVEELSTAARITGLAFDALSSHGTNFSPVVGKPDLYSLTVRGEGYVCHKSAIPSMSGFLDVVNIPGVPNGQALEKEDTPSGREEKDWGSLPEEESAEEDFFEGNATEGNAVREDTEEGNATADNAAKEDIFDKGGHEETGDPEETESPHESPEEEAGGETQIPNIGSFIKNDFFTEETEKAAEEIVYEMFGVAMTHSGYSGGGKALDAQIMVAPLKIQKFSCPSVPIIVSVYYKGKIVTSSSYDQAEDGKNLVMLNVDEFYLLFRGSFDGNGKFKAFITTTGISASQGDILNITSETRYGDNAGRNVRNGHVKFRATVYDDPGTVEAFPFGDPDNNEFIIMTKTDEFVDYLYLSRDAGGLKSAVIYQDGEKKQVDCKWEDGKMAVSIAAK